MGKHIRFEPSEVIGFFREKTRETAPCSLGNLLVEKDFRSLTIRIREYPKGRKQHSHSLPQELWERLVVAQKVAEGELVVPSPRGSQFILPHHWYLYALKRYCEELEIPVVGTHGLRHSTSEIYLQAGASRDDLRQLFAHSSLVVTDRYIRGKASNLERVSNVIKLFPSENAQFGPIADVKNVHAANSLEIKVSK